MSKKRSFEYEDESDSSESEFIDTGVCPLGNLDESGDNENCPAANTKDKKKVKDATNTDNKEDNMLSKEKKKVMDLQKRSQVTQQRKGK